MRSSESPAHQKTGRRARNVTMGFRWRANKGPKSSLAIAQSRAEQSQGPGRMKWGNLLMARVRACLLGNPMGAGGRGTRQHGKQEPVCLFPRGINPVSLASASAAASEPKSRRRGDLVGRPASSRTKPIRRSGDSCSFLVSSKVAISAFFSFLFVKNRCIFCRHI
ncbi:hypothetical protein LX32DRAFT_222004 [Colletotrichum zoysiae]|uniref:Uncharacterized protein n=1 Tax=Colletotrichum zoysiae TaxID=1216348 RepID=A0AAD9LXP0_9PEZI|nr:hypothetical protein LX32DRAFT_222004 [Colletotrichum zoysiae]